MEEAVIGSVEDVVNLLREAKRVNCDNDALEGCVKRSTEYVCHSSLSEYLLDQIDRYVSASLRGNKRRVDSRVCLISAKEGLPEELDYALVWFDFVYPVGEHEDRFVDDLFNGVEMIARKFPLEEV